MAVAGPCKHCCTGPELCRDTPGSFPSPLGDLLRFETTTRAFPISQPLPQPSLNQQFWSVLFWLFLASPTSSTTRSPALLSGLPIYRMGPMALTWHVVPWRDQMASKMPAPAAKVKSVQTPTVPQRPATMVRMIANERPLHRGATCLSTSAWSLA